MQKDFRSTGVGVQLDNIQHSYGRSTAVDAVDLEIAPGELVALLGPSGCGKTTLLKVLLGLLKPTEGQVVVNGRDLRDWDLGQYRARIGAVMQVLVDAARGWVAKAVRVAPMPMPPRLMAW